MSLLWSWDAEYSSAGYIRTAAMAGVFYTGRKLRDGEKQRDVCVSVRPHERGMEGGMGKSGGLGENLSPVKIKTPSVTQSGVQRDPNDSRHTHTHTHKSTFK